MNEVFFLIFFVIFLYVLFYEELNSYWTFEEELYSISEEYFEMKYLTIKTPYIITIDKYIEIIFNAPQKRGAKLKNTNKAS